MGTALLLVLGVLAVVALLFAFVFRPWGATWGSTAAERAAPMAGDGWVPGPGPGRRGVAMTRAVTLPCPPGTAWSWLAQVGRGAGFHSYDRLDNGGRPSADRILPWIPPPRLGDATAVGYLRHLVPGREMAWWMPEERWLGSRVTMACAYRLDPEGTGTRLLMRVTGSAEGPTAGLVLVAFVLMDSLMARRQLLGLRARTGQVPPGSAATASPARDAFQLYEAIFADGTRAGVPGKEQAVRWHEAARRDLGTRFGATSSEDDPRGPGR